MAANTSTFVPTAVSHIPDLSVRSGLKPKTIQSPTISLRNRSPVDPTKILAALTGYNKNLVQHITLGLEQGFQLKYQGERRLVVILAQL